MQQPQAVWSREVAIYLQQFCAFVALANFVAVNLVSLYFNKILCPQNLLKSIMDSDKFIVRVAFAMNLVLTGGTGTDTFPWKHYCSPVAFTIIICSA